MGLTSRKLSGIDWLCFTDCQTSFSSLSPSSSLCTVSDSISFKVDEILSVNPSANVFYKDWLTYSGGSDRPGVIIFYHK